MSITGIVNVDNTITGVEDLYLDELDVNTIVLGGNDLQTTLTNLQNQITTGGGYFQVIGEAQSTASSSKNFSFGANTNDSELKVYLPNSTWYGVALSSGGVITSPVDIDIIINSVTYTYSIPNGSASTYTNYNLNTAVTQGQTLRAKFGTNLGTGGSNYRITLFFRTNAVNGTNGTNGTNGQNVSFNIPTITTITPATSASIDDTIVTASGTQTHSLNFNIPRGKNASFQVGTISSVGTASPTLDITHSTNGNGDNVYTMNFGLQQGIQGQKGDKGDKGDTGNQAQSTLDAIAAAAISVGAASAASASAAAAAASALTAAGAGAAAGAQAGAEAAEGVLAEQNVRITQLETDVDALQYKTNYISRNAGETTIGGSRTIVNSTYGLLTNTMEADSINVSNTINTNDLNVVGQSYFGDNITLADTIKLLTNNIFQRQYPASGDILIDATNLNIGDTTNTINTTSTNYYSSHTVYDVDATDITLSSDLDYSEITIGSILDIESSATINTRTINIGTTQIGMTDPILNIGTYNRTTTQVRGETIEILASETTSINGSNNLEIDSTHIVMGNSGGDIVINGATIDIGTAGILNTINIGNDYSIVNINTGIGQYINIPEFINQLGY